MFLLTIHAHYFACYHRIVTSFNSAALFTFCLYKLNIAINIAVVVEMVVAVVDVAVK